jgi:WD40 repeat protein
MVHTIHGHTQAVDDLAFSPDGQRIVSAGLNQQVRVWDATLGVELLTLEGPSAEIQCVEFSPDGKRMVAASDDGTVRYWDADR